MPDLEGKVAVVTGSSRGIGRAVAMVLAERGCDVVVNYVLSPAAAGEATQAIEAMGRRALAVCANVAKPEGVARLFGETEQHFGQIDVLVCNAARSGFAPLVDLTLPAFDLTIANNVRSVLACVHASLPLMKGSIGRIITMTAVGSSRWLPGYGAAAASKTAIEALTRYLAVELASRGITVNAVRGGAVETDALGFLPPGWVERLRERTPLGRLGTPRDVAEMVGFLCSPAAEWVTGQEFCVDGGYSLT